MQEKTPIATDEVRQAIDEALARLPGTATRKDKTRLVASLLFLEHGIYPSAKVVLDHTRQGSLTDINSDLRQFWADLRDRMRAKVSAPFLPQDLLDRYAEALSGLWDLALAKANDELQAQRQEAAESVKLAQAEASDALRNRQLAEEQAKEMGTRLEAEAERRQEAQMRAEAMSVEIDGLQTSLAQWREKAQAEASARQEAERQFSRDLEAERSDRQREAERFIGESRFAKMQIEQARASERELRQQLATALQSKELELATYRKRASAAEEALGAVRLELAEMRGRAQVLERNLAEVGAGAKERTLQPVKRAPIKAAVRRTLRQERSARITWK